VFPRFRRGAFFLFAIVFAVSLLLGDRPLASELALRPLAFVSGEGLWAPLTAGFLFPDAQLAALAFTLLVQWFFGSPLEGFWGTRRYVVMVLVSVVVGYATTGLLALWVPAVAAVTAMSGATPLDLATATAFGVVFAKQDYSLFGMQPIKGRILAGFTVLLVLALPVARAGGLEAWPALLPSVFAVLVALVFVTQPWRRKGKSGNIGGRKKRKNAPHLRVVREADDMLN
jgi:membrane associated rhomboid family serine protease